MRQGDVDIHRQLRIGAFLGPLDPVYQPFEIPRPVRGLGGIDALEQHRAIAPVVPRLAGAFVTQPRAGVIGGSANEALALPPADVRMNRQMIARHVPQLAGWPRRMAGRYRLPGAT